MKRILVGGLLFLCCGLVPAEELYQELSASLEQAEALVAAVVVQDRATLSAQQLEALESLNRRIRGSLYSDLIDRSELLVLLAREQMRLGQDPRARAEEMLRDSLMDSRNLRAGAVREKALRLSFGATLVSFAAAFSFWGLGELQDRLYFESATAEDASRRRRLFQVFSVGSVIATAVGVAGAGVSITLYAGAHR